MNGLPVRPLTAADAPWAARRHAALLPHSVFALFGPPFLETIYRAFARSPHAVSFVHERDGAPHALIACASDRRAFLRELLLRSGLRLALLAGAAFLTRGPCRRLLLQAPRYLRRTHRSGTDAEMIFITVDPECHGTGVGRGLILAVLEEYRRRGVERVTVTIESDNAPVKRLLLGLGFAVEDTFTFADKSNDLLVLEGAVVGAPRGKATA